MTDVYLRYEGGANTSFLADVPFAELDSVIAVLTAWGIDDGEHELSAQFVYCNAGASHFEVTIHPVSA